MLLLSCLSRVQCWDWLAWRQSAVTGWGSEFGRQFSVSVLRRVQSSEQVRVVETVCFRDAKQFVVNKLLLIFVVSRADVGLVGCLFSVSRGVGWLAECLLSRRRSGAGIMEADDRQVTTQSNRPSTIGSRQTEYHEALSSSANDEVRCD